MDSSGASTSTPYKSYINLKTIQIPVLFKLKTKSGAYLEIGPQFNLLTSANYHYAADQATVDTLVTSAYSNSYFSAVLGFGWKIKFGKTSPLSMLIGARFQYSFTDLKGVDGLGVALNNPFYYKTSASTSAATGGVMIGLTYQLGKKKV